MEIRLAGIIFNRKTVIDTLDELSERGYGSDNVSIAARQYGSIYKKPEVDFYGKFITETLSDAESGFISEGMVKKMIEEGGAVPEKEGILMLAGPIAVGLGGAPVRVQAGGLTGALRDIGLTDEQIDVYTKAIDAGEVLIVVHTDDEHAGEIAGILNRYRVTDLHITARRDRLVR